MKPKTKLLGYIILSSLFTAFLIASGFILSYKIECTLAGVMIAILSLIFHVAFLLKKRKDFYSEIQENQDKERMLAFQRARDPLNRIFQDGDIVHDDYYDETFSYRWTKDSIHEFYKGKFRIASKEEKDIYYNNIKNKQIDR